MFKNYPQKIVAIIEARMTSSRLPGKVLLPLCGKPSLEHLILRLKRSVYLDSIVVATTSNDADAPVVAVADRLGVSVFRGSEADVLGRVLGAAESAKADIIVEITGDCPFVDWRLVDRSIEEFFKQKVDYIGNNTISPFTFPNGFDVQVFPTKVLREVSKLTNDPIDRTHVSYYIYQHPELYKLGRFDATSHEYGPDLRVTLDERADYKLLQKLCENILPKNSDPSASDIVSFLRSNKNIALINKNVTQKEPNEL